MRLDIIGENVVASIERGVAKRFGNGRALLIVSATAASMFVAILYATTAQDAKAEEGVDTATQQSMSYVLKEPVAGPPTEAPFTYAILGASECIRIGDGQNLAKDLSMELVNRHQLRVRSCDFCLLGASLEYKYRAVVAASLLDVDLIVVTHSVLDAHVLFAEGVRFESPLVNVSDDVVALAFVTTPVSIIEAFLTGRFSSYENRFEHSLARTLAPGRFEVFKVATQGVNEKSANNEVLMTDSILADSINPRIVSELQSKLSMNPKQAFELIAAAAIEKNISIVFVVTPINRAEASKEVIASTDAFSKELLEAEEYFRNEYTNVRIWSAYREDIFSQEDFLDIGHFKNFDWITDRLVEVIDEEGFLPDERQID